MAEFQLFAWKFSDFGENFPTQLSGAEFDAEIDIVFNPSSDAATLLVDGDRDNVVLVQDFVQCEEVFPAGSVIVIEYSAEISGSAEDKLFICRIKRPFDMESAAGYRLVFASGALTEGRNYKIRSLISRAGQNYDSVNFARGTLIDTPHGPLAIERLEDGDEVLTRDGGIQLIHRVALKRYSGLELVLNPQLRPVCIQAGALMGGLPGTNLIVAQQHRLLLDDWRAAYLFGEEEILVPAKSLLNQLNVTIECPETGVDYLQLALETPDLVSANGLWAEACTSELEHADLPKPLAVADETDHLEVTYYDISDSYAKELPTLPHSSAVSIAA